MALHKTNDHISLHPFNSPFFLSVVVMHYTLCLFSVVSQITAQAANHLEAKTKGLVFLLPPREKYFFQYSTKVSTVKQ